MKKRLSVTIDEDLLRTVDSWRGSSPRSPLYEGLVQGALDAGLQLQGLFVEHEKEGGVSRVFVGDDSRVFTHEVRGEALEGQHVFDALRCEACRALRETVGGSA